MPGPCTRCNGMGWGELNKEFGIHRGTDPCPDCEAGLNKRLEEGRLDIVETIGGKKKVRRPEISMGRPTKLPVERKTTVEVVGGGKVDLNEEPQSVDDLIAAGVVTQEQVDAQNAADLDAMKEEGFGS